jgi:hypothetical protein
MRKLTYAVSIEHCLQHRNRPKPKDCAVCRETIAANRETEQRQADRHTRKRAKKEASEAPRRAKKAARKRVRRDRQQSAAAETS